MAGKLVSLVDHGQIPHDLNVLALDTGVFRAPGGKAYNFFSGSRLSWNMLSVYCGLEVMTFIGGGMYCKANS